MKVPVVQNRFAGESKEAGIMGLLTPQQKAQLLDELLANVPQGREIDLSKPVTEPYVFREFPKLLYNHESGEVAEVGDKVAAKAAIEAGFSTEPAPDRDYSKMRGNIAQRA